MTGKLGMMRRLFSWLILLLMQGLIFSTGSYAGDLTGTVTDLAGGQAIVGLDMNIYDSNWAYLEINAITAAGGIYRFSDLDPGEYYVRANPKYPFHYQHQYWQNSPDRAGAIPVTVPATGEVTGIDFALIDGCYILGKISESSSGTILSGISVRVYDTEWTRMDIVTESDQYGRYYAGGLPGGDYFVMAAPSYPQPYVDQYFDHSAGPIHAVAATLVPPNDLLGVSFDLESGNYILGQITDKDTGMSIKGIRVKGYNNNGSVMRIDDRTDDEGRYILGAYREGDYYVRADPSYPNGYMDQYYPDAFTMDMAQMVSVSLPKPHFDVNLALSAGSYMRGTVTSLDSLPLEGIKIKFYDRNWNYLELATTYTKPDGTYLSGALKPGMYYTKAVPVYPQPWIDEYYPDAVEQDDAEQIPMALAGETTGIDLMLQPGGYLTGTIIHASHTDPLDDIDLDVYDSNWSWVSYSAHSRSNGEFVLGALPFGSYYLQTDPTLGQGFVPLFFNNVFMPDAAELIVLSAGQNAEHLDFALTDGGFVAGTVVDADSGLPVENIEITVLTESETVIPIHRVVTDTTGNYIAHGIPGGVYYIAAAADPDDDYMTQYYQHSSTIADASPITVTPLQTQSGIDFQLFLDPKPTATPAITLGVQLEMPSDMFRYKDLFYLNARIANPGQSMTGIPLFIILDIAGEMFFWPSWRGMEDGFDYQVIDVENGVRILPVLPAFEWPKINGTMADLHFYGGMTRSDFSRLLGDMDIITFGYTDQ